MRYLVGIVLGLLLCGTSAYGTNYNNNVRGHSYGHNVNFRGHYNNFGYVNAVQYRTVSYAVAAPVYSYPVLLAPAYAAPVSYQAQLSVQAQVAEPCVCPVTLPAVQYVAPVAAVQYAAPVHQSYSVGSFQSGYCH